MSALFTSDIHLDDKPLNEYRWGLLPWLKEQAIKLAIDVIILGGDSTDQKDRHTAKLVNRFIDALASLAEVCDVIILMGNHDCLDPKEPYFRFSTKVGEGRVEFIYEPSLIYLPIGKSKTPCWFLPHTRNLNDWDGLEFNKASFIFCHQTFNGAKAENGQTLTGIAPSYFATFKGKVWSGDIHVPQKISKNIEYIGSPYRVRFGDSFNPRVVFTDNTGAVSDLRFPCPNRHALTIHSLGVLRTHDIKSGDQVKVRVELSRTDYPQWPQIRTEIREMADTGGWQLCGCESTITQERSEQKVQQKAVDPADLVKNYAEAHGFDKELTQLGLSFLEDRK